MLLTLRKSIDRFLLGLVDVKNTPDKLVVSKTFLRNGESWQSFRSPHGAERADKANQGSEAAAVEEADVFQLEYESLGLESVFFDLE